MGNAGEGKMEKTQGILSFLPFLEECFSFLKVQARGSHSRLFLSLGSLGRF